MKSSHSAAGKQRLSVISIQNVMYIEAQKHNVVVHCADEAYLTRGPLKKFEKRLAGSGFVRVHRSFLVSMDHIKTIDDKFIILDDPDKTSVPVGDKYGPGLFEAVENGNFLILRKIQ